MAVNKRHGYIINESFSVLTLQIDGEITKALYPKNIYSFSRRSLSKSTKLTIYYHQRDYLRTDSILQLQLQEAVEDIMIFFSTTDSIDHLPCTTFQDLELFMATHVFLLNQLPEYDALARVMNDIKANRNTYNIYGGGQTFLLLDIFNNSLSYRAHVPLLNIDLRKLWGKRSR